MSQAHKAGKVGYSGTIVEDLGGHTISLALVYTTAGAACCDSTSILTAMLQKIEGIVNLDGGLGVRICVDDGDNTAHDGLFAAVSLWSA